MYTIKEAAARSGVGIPLLRAWERRYGVVSPSRTASGYRLYDEEAIQRLTAMRALIADGWSAQQAAGRIRSASRDELAAAVAPSPTSRPAESPGVQGVMPDASARSELVARIVAAASAIDGAAVERALDDTFGALRFEAAVGEVLMPALRAIGDAWEAGDVTVGGEHATSHAVLRRLALAFEAAGVATTEPPVLVGLGPGARHELGPLAFAVAARRAGLPVLYLGADLPIESWVSAAAEREAPAAVVGVPRRSDVDRASDVLGALRAARPSMILAVGGGHAGRVTDPGVLQLPDSIGEAADRLRTLLDR